MAEYIYANTVLTGEDYAKLMWLMERTGYLSRSTYIRFLIRKEYERQRAVDAMLLSDTSVSEKAGRE